MRGIMDQTPQPPVQPTEPVAPMPPQAPLPPNTPNNSVPPSPGSNKGLIIGLVVGVIVLLLVIAGIVLAVTLGGKDTKNNTQDRKNNTNTTKTDESKEDALRSANAKTAKYQSEMSAVCENGSITNAGDFAKPYKVIAFSKNSTNRNYTSATLPYGTDYAAKYSDPIESVNVVACLDEKPDTAVKSKTCDFKSGSKMTTLDYYALKYTVTLREAKSGKLIKTLEDVNAPATTCPMFATYDKNDPKYYARPDSTALDAAIKQFVTE